MAVTETAQVVAAERLNGGLVIKFNDGKCAFYPASMLHAMFSQAEELDETHTAW